MAKKLFCHLHVHSQHSSLDGMGAAEDYAAKAAELGQPALAITDHGNLAAAPAFYHACKENDVEPLLGSEFYYVHDADYRPEKGEEYERHHVTVLARGEEGYKVLSELSTESHRHYYYKPLVDRSILESLGGDARHLTVLSGCAASAISHALRAKNYPAAIEELTWWREHFPNFYIELMHHDTEFDLKLNKQLIKLGRKYKIPLVITNDPHYVEEEDAPHHDALLAIQTASDIDDPSRFSFDGHGYHLRSYDEMRAAFRPYGKEVWQEGSRNTVRIAKENRTKIPDWEKRVWRIPHYPDAEDSFEELKRLTKKGLRKRGRHKDKKYIERCKEELRVIKSMELPDFLLITRDCIEYARSEGIPVGPGRGSVCGTLVGYFIGIHKVDSIRYNLMFERFLNPARPRMPDIDTDFGPSGRDKMFTYVAERYGEENTVKVAAYQTMRAKRALQSLGKAYGISFPERLRLSKMLSNDDDPEDVLPNEVLESYPDLASQLSRLSGIKSGFSAHPAGVIIADPSDNIKQLVPEMWIASSKKMVGQYDLDAAEEMGLMKQDFLSVRTLDTIAECVRLIKEHTGEEIEPDEWIPDEEPRDEEVWKLISKGKTAGVFQMEGVVNTRGAQDVKPVSFDDIVSITSLYRTGPIQAGYPQKFLENRAAGKEEIEYEHELLRPVLEETWGVILFQEQVMDIAHTLAGFDMGRVDDIKEAIKHKRSKLMIELQPEFVEGCEKNGVPASAAKRVWKDIEGYSGYAYNKIHATAYSIITYQTARLKLLYPLFYYAALLRTVDDDDKVVMYLREAVEQGFKIVPPDINLSDTHATPEPERKTIRFGFTDYKGIGEKQAAKIVANRPPEGYTSYEQVEEAVRNKGVLAVLADGSAMESIGAPGNPARTEELLNWTFRDNMKKYRKKYKDEACLPEFDGQEVCLIGEIFKVDRARTKNGKPYATWKLRWSLSQSFDVRLWAETERLWDIPKGSIVMVTGKWEARWLNVGVSDPDNVRLIKKSLRR